MTITPLKLMMFVIAMIALIYGLAELHELYWDWRNNVESLYVTR